MSPSRSRIAVVAGLLVLGLLVLAVHLARLMVVQRELWLERGAKNRWAFRDVPARRGAILDRNGIPLVEDEPAFALWLDPPRFLQRHPYGQAAAIAALLRLEALGGEAPALVRRVLELPVAALEAAHLDAEQSKRARDLAAHMLSAVFPARPGTYARAVRAARALEPRAARPRGPGRARAGPGPARGAAALVPRAREEDRGRGGSRRGRSDPPRRRPRPRTRRRSRCASRGAPSFDLVALVAREAREYGRASTGCRACSAAPRARPAAMVSCISARETVSIGSGRALWRSGPSPGRPRAEARRGRCGRSLLGARWTRLGRRSSSATTRTSDLGARRRRVRTRGKPLRRHFPRQAAGSAGHRASSRGRRRPDLRADARRACSNVERVRSASPENPPPQHPPHTVTPPPPQPPVTAR
jgi:hypothetical protein